MPPPNPEWVNRLQPSGPQGSELLAHERAKSNIDVEKLAEFLFTKEVLDRRQRILSILQSEKIFDKSQNYFDGRVDRIQKALAKAKRMRQLSEKYNWSDDDYLVANELISEPTPYGLHDHMFLVCIANLIARQRKINPRRKLFANKEHRSNISCSLRKPRNMNTLGAMPRQNWVMEAMFEASRLEQHGIPRTRRSLCTPHTLRLRSGGSDLLGKPPTTLLLWHS